MQLKNIAVQFILLVSFIFYSNIAAAQTAEQLIVGNWKFSKIEFEEADTDEIIEITEEWKGVEIHISQDNKFVTYKKNNGKLIEMGKGKYTIENGKYFYQDEQKAEIIKLNDKEFVLKIEELEVTIYFIKINKDP